MCVRCRNTKNEVSSDSTQPSFFNQSGEFAGRWTNKKGSVFDGEKSIDSLKQEITEDSNIFTL